MSDPRIYGFPPVHMQEMISGRPQPVKKEEGGFADALMKGLKDVNDAQAKADQSVNDLATGKRKTLHETMISVEKAEISFKLMMAVRNKLLSAYQEISRMNF